MLRTDCGLFKEYFQSDQRFFNIWKNQNHIYIQIYNCRLKNAKNIFRASIAVVIIFLKSSRYWNLFMISQSFYYYFFLISKSLTSFNNRSVIFNFKIHNEHFFPISKGRCKISKFAMKKKTFPRSAKNLPISSIFIITDTRKYVTPSKTIEMLRIICKKKDDNSNPLPIIGIAFFHFIRKYQAQIGKTTRWQQYSLMGLKTGRRDNLNFGMQNLR